MYQTFLLCIVALIALFTHPISGAIFPEQVKKKMQNSFALQILSVIAISYWIVRSLGLSLIVASIFFLFRATAHLKANFTN
jgi:hypothetical protein